MALHLIIGPAYSGKSDLLPTLVKEQGPVWVLGTGPADNPYLGPDIAEIKKNRPSPWKSLDSTDLIEDLKSLAAGQNNLAAIAIDSLNQWLGQVVAWGSERFDFDQLGKHADLSAKELLTILIDLSQKLQIYCVSTEVGSGSPPAGACDRVFRKTLGKLHRQVAAQSEAVHLIQCGIPQQIKP